MTLRMPTAYTPKAPAAPGTDDYRCFLLDPGLTAKSVVTGINVLPGNPDVVHHVILFRVPPTRSRARRRRTASRSARAGPVSAAPGWRARAPG